MKFLLFAALVAIFFWLGKSWLDRPRGMSAGDAAKLLEVAPDADADTIVAAHRRLIAKVHPDAGGSAKLAAQVNEARDILIKRLPKQE